MTAALEQSFRSANDDRWILVFEDDALMTPGFKHNLLQAIQDCPSDGEMIQCWYGSSASPLALRVGKSLVDDGKKPSTRTGTYAINQKGARKWAGILRDRQCTEHTDENPYYSSMITYKCIKSSMPYLMPLFLHSREQLACANTYMRDHCLRGALMGQPCAEPVGLLRSVLGVLTFHAFDDSSSAQDASTEGALKAAAAAGLHAAGDS